MILKDKLIMKLHISKLFSTIAFSALALAGCSKDDVDQVLKLSSESPVVTINGNKASVELTSEGGRIPFTLNKTHGWEASVSEDAIEWCHVYQANDKLAIAVDDFASDEQESRTAQVQILESDISKATIILTQKASAKPYITISPESTPYISYKGGELKVSISSNVPLYDAELRNMDLNWASYKIDGNTITIKAGKNITGEEMHATLLVSAINGSEVATAEYNFKQGNGEMQLEYVIPEDGKTVKLPICGDDLDCTVDWGDGSDKIFVKGYVSSYSRIGHQYAKAGTYNISISGIVDEFNSNDSGVTDYFKAIRSWGALQIKSLKNAFKGTSMTQIPLPEEPDLFANVESISGAFEKMAALTTAPEGLFDTAINVTDASNLFYDCKALESVPENFFSNMTKLEDISNMFYNCQSLKQVPVDLFKSNTAVSMVTALFSYSGLESIPAGFFDFGENIKMMITIFAGCEKLKEIPDGLFDKLPEITRFQSTFLNCTSLTSIPTALFDNCKKLNIIQYMFKGCTGLTGESPYTMVDGVKVHLYERNDHLDVFTKIPPKDAKGTFAECTGLSDYATMPDKYKEN